MPTFLRTHWKTLAAIVLLVLLAPVAVRPRAMPAPPAPSARLRAHVDALASPAPRQAADAGTYIEAVLRGAGYTVHTEADGDGVRRLEAVIARAGPGRARHTFIVGAHLYGRDATLAPSDADENAGGSAAVLELARRMKDVRPAPATDIRFVFFLDPRAAPAADADSGGGVGGGFVAYAGTLASARRVQDALAAFQGAANAPARGLAAPAYLQGVTLADSASWPQPGGAALVVIATSFTRFPYRHADGADAGPDAPPEERVLPGMARVVAALARTLTALAAGQQG